MAENKENASASCTHDCSSCGKSCSERKGPVREPANKGSNVGKIIGVVSGKGGVGKSLVTSLLAIGTHRAGKKAAVLDADITGPSIPKIFGTHGDILSNGEAMIPQESAAGIKVMSLGFFLKNPDDPVVWRGPVISGTVKQFWTDVAWGDVDYMYIDMPPGTGDVALTIFQSFPIDGIVIVTSPQELVGEIVGKAVKMASMMNIPVLGLVENMSYLPCPDCGKEIRLFGESRVEELAAKYSVPVLAKLPIDPSLASLCDSGALETTESPAPAVLAEAVAK